MERRFLVIYLYIWYNITMILFHHWTDDSHVSSIFVTKATLHFVTLLSNCALIPIASGGSDGKYNCVCCSVRLAASGSHAGDRCAPALGHSGACGLRDHCAILVRVARHGYRRLRACEGQMMSTLTSVGRLRTPHSPSLS